MRKEYLILIIFLVVIGVSGAIIYVAMNSHSAATKIQAEMPMNEQSTTPQMPPSQEQGEGMTFGETAPQGPDTKALQNQIDLLESQLKADPNNFDALVNLGNNYYDIGNPDKSIENYEKALKLRPNEAMVMVDCGAMYRQKGDPDKAIEMFNKAIVIDPKLPQAYFNLGMVLRMEKNNPTEAAKAWRTYLQLDPNSEAKEFLTQEINKAEGK